MAVGQSTLRRDAFAKVTGHATYPSDLIPVDAMWAKVVFTNQAHARLIRCDLDAARAVDGVVCILTAADVPVNEYGLTLFDQPVLLGLEHTGRASTRCDISRWEADALCVIVAETIEQADAAAAAIVVEWEQLPIINDIESALTTSVMLHPENGLDTNA